MRATHCRQCGKARTADRTLSRRALCMACAELNLNQAADELRAKSGPAYEQWRKSSLEAYARLARE